MNEKKKYIYFTFSTLNNYFIWQAVKPLSSYLSKKFRDAAKILRKALFGSEGGEESWRYCVSDTNNALGIVFQKQIILVNKYFMASVLKSNI